MGSRLDIKEGDRYDRLTVISEAERYVLPSGQTNRAVLCRCDCGNIKKIRLLHLVRGRIKSCGCLTGESHGGADTKLYKKWRAIKYRCYVSPYFNNYIENGVTVCDEWNKSFIAFREWALNNGYKPELQIDRIDNNKGYSPDNCRFVTNLENANNRSNTKRVIYKGKEYALMMLLREKNMLLHERGIRGRLKKGMNIEEALSKPFLPANNRIAQNEEEAQLRLETFNNKKSGRKRKIVRWR